MAGLLNHGKTFTRLPQGTPDGPYELVLDYSETVSNTTWRKIASLLANRGVPSELLPEYADNFNLDEDRIRNQCEQIREAIWSRDPLPEDDPLAFYYNLLLGWIAAGDYFFFAQS
ncbi:MAG: hypothetical protein R3F62_15885 [Planctomycetota bacterium]